MSLLGPRRSQTNRGLLLPVVLAGLLLLLCVTNPALASAHSEGADHQPTEEPETPRLMGDAFGGEGELSTGLSVASIFPFTTARESPDPTDRELVGIGDDRADRLFEALGSETSRDVLARLLREPQTPSELAETTDTSLQNVHYHLEKLEDAGAIEEVAVEYSSRGREMSVYAATCQPRLLVYDLD